MSDERWRHEFARLYGLTRVEYADCDVRYTVDPVPEAQVSRLHLVAITPEGNAVVSRSDQGWRFLPGGTREPGESIDELARRELLEEAGAEMLGTIAPFSAFVTDGTAAGPYRAHLPFPRAYWLHAVVRARVNGPPTSPADGEQIVEVLQLPPREAVEYLAVHDPIHADVLAHAIAMDLVGDRRHRER